MKSPDALRPLFAALRIRWDGMPLRDRRALAALAVFFSLAGGWLGVVQPALTFADEGREALESAAMDLAWMQANATVARQAAAQGPGANDGQSLLSAVNGSARGMGLNLQRFEPEGEQRVRVTLENAVFTDVMRWVVLLETRYGLVVEHFNADSRQPGVVNIRMTVGKSS
jgi:general secretion pathway protein M